MPTEYGMFKITVFRQKSNGLEHMVLTKGRMDRRRAGTAPRALLVRHGRHFGIVPLRLRRTAPREAMRMIEKKQGRRRLSQPGRTRHRTLQQDRSLQTPGQGLDTVDANVRLGFGVDERDYGVGASIIREMGIKHMRLMTNNPLKE